MKEQNNSAKKKNPLPLGKNSSKKIVSENKGGTKTID